MFDLNIGQQIHYIRLYIKHMHQSNSEQKKVTQKLDTKL